MSWDVSVYAAASPPPPIREMPRDWIGDTLGTAEEVRRKISACLPGVDWSEPVWGLFEGQGFSFEFNMRRDPVTSFMIHVRGGGDAVACLLDLAAAHRWYLLDCSASEWFHHSEDPEAGWQGFQAYRDRVLGLED